jgi:YebC/PmpR family DNA-binding regulatory protein
MHKKEKTDAQRAKVFTKIGKEISMSVKQNGPDPVSNTKLRDLISKAKSLNVPNDNIDRIIKKASSNDGLMYEVVNYEGYGIGGVAVIVEATTENRNRTAADVRHYFDKFGGNMGTTGCVSFMFEDKGVIIVDGEDIDEDKFMEDALDSGAEDFNPDGDVFEVTTDVGSLDDVRDAISGKGYKIISAEPDKIPSTYVTLTDEEQILKMQKLLDMLDENEDVTGVWHNWDNEE